MIPPQNDAKILKTLLPIHNVTLILETMIPRLMLIRYQRHNNIMITCYHGTPATVKCYQRRTQPIHNTTKTQHSHDITLPRQNLSNTQPPGQWTKLGHYKATLPHRHYQDIMLPKQIAIIPWHYRDATQG